MTHGQIDFLRKRGKFMPADEGLTVDTSKFCNH